MKKTLIFLTLTIFAQLLYSQDTLTLIEYEYVTITTDNRSPKEVFISYSNGEFEERKIESSGKFDYSGTLKIINEKEKQGFELFSNSFTTYSGNVTIPHNYFIMRKRIN